MFLSEIPKGASVNLMVKNKAGASAVFHSVAIEGTRIAGQRHALIINCVKHEGKVVNFEGFSITAQINLPGPDSRACNFVLNGITTTKRNNVTYHVIISNDNATQKDRRDSVRVDLNEQANIKIGDKPQITVRAKDLSLSGISFLLPGSTTVREGDFIEGVFVCTALNGTYQVAATVARVAKLPDGQILIGCRMNNLNKSIVALVTYLAKKQGKAVS